MAAGAAGVLPFCLPALSQLWHNSRLFFPSPSFFSSFFSPFSIQSQQFKGSNLTRSLRGRSWWWLRGHRSSTAAGWKEGAEEARLTLMWQEMGKKRVTFSSYTLLSTNFMSAGHLEKGLKGPRDCVRFCASCGLQNQPWSKADRNSGSLDGTGGKGFTWDRERTSPAGLTALAGPAGAGWGGTVTLPQELQTPLTTASPATQCLAVPSVSVEETHFSFLKHWLDFWKQKSPLLYSRNYTRY